MAAGRRTAVLHAKRRTCRSANTLRRWRSVRGAGGVRSSTSRTSPYTPVVDRYVTWCGSPLSPLTTRGVGSSSRPWRRRVGIEIRTCAPAVDTVIPVSEAASKGNTSAPAGLRDWRRSGFRVVAATSHPCSSSSLATLRPVKPHPRIKARRRTPPPTGPHGSPSTPGTRPRPTPRRPSCHRTRAASELRRPGFGTRSSAFSHSDGS